MRRIDVQLPLWRENRRDAARAAKSKIANARKRGRMPVSMTSRYQGFSKGSEAMGNEKVEALRRDSRVELVAGEKAASKSYAPQELIANRQLLPVINE